jgi:predicted ferric reductase
MEGDNKQQKKNQVRLFFKKRSIQDAVCMHTCNRTMDHRSTCPIAVEDEAAAERNDVRVAVASEECAQL